MKCEAEAQKDEAAHAWAFGNWFQRDDEEDNCVTWVCPCGAWKEVKYTESRKVEQNDTSTRSEVLAGKL